MDHVFAKVKGRGKQLFFKLISNYTLYDDLILQVASYDEYSPGCVLEEDEWFKIEQFSEQPFCINLLKGEFDSKNYNDLTRDQFSKIAYIFSVQGKDFYFQKITPSLFVRRKMLIFGEVAEVESSEDRLVVSSEPDVVYLKDEDVLVFKSLATISSIFRGIDQLYREATNQEVKHFLDESFIEVVGNYEVEKVSKPNRKRVALAQKTLDSLSQEDRIDMLDYIDSYCDQELKYDKDNEKFEISTDDELKLLLYGIDQRFYTTPLGHEKRLAKSIKPL